jgi:hypothetical protein
MHLPYEKMIRAPIAVQAYQPTQDPNKLQLAVLATVVTTLHKCPWLPSNSKPELQEEASPTGLEVEHSTAVASEAATLLATLLTIDDRSLKNDLSSAFHLAWHCASVDAFEAGAIRRRPEVSALICFPL